MLCSERAGQHMVLITAAHNALSLHKHIINHPKKTSSHSITHKPNKPCYLWKNSMRERRVESEGRGFRAWVLALPLSSLNELQTWFWRFWSLTQDEPAMQDNSGWFSEIWPAGGAICVSVHKKLGLDEHTCSGTGDVLRPEIVFLDGMRGKCLLVSKRLALG